MLQARSLAATLTTYHTTSARCFSPHLSRSGNRSKDPYLRDLGCYYPLIECRFDPLWNGHRADVAALADQLPRPVPLADLDFIQLQATSSDLRNHNPNSQGQHGVVALRRMLFPRAHLSLPTLLRAQSISGAKPELLDTFHSADPRS